MTASEYHDKVEKDDGRDFLKPTPTHQNAHGTQTQKQTDRYPVLHVKSVRSDTPAAAAVALARGLAARATVLSASASPSASTLELFVFNGGRPSPPTPPDVPRSGVPCFCCAPRRLPVDGAEAPPPPQPPPSRGTAEEGGEEDTEEPRSPCEVEKRWRGPPLRRKGWLRISSRDGRSSGFTCRKGRGRGRCWKLVMFRMPRFVS